MTTCRNFSSNTSKLPSLSSRSDSLSQISRRIATCWICEAPRWATFSAWMRSARLTLSRRPLATLYATKRRRRKVSTMPSHRISFKIARSGNWSNFSQSCSSRAFPRSVSAPMSNSKSSVYTKPWRLCCLSTNKSTVLITFGS